MRVCFSRLLPFFPLVVGYQLVAAFRRQQDRGGCDPAGEQHHDGPADGAEDPGGVEFPAGEEAVVVVVEVCLMEFHGS